MFSSSVQTVSISASRPGSPRLARFSGGRDSSIVLAAAAATSRSLGLPPPVPVTLRFGFAEADEREWQELVVRHLGLSDWIRIDITDELDIVGDRSTGLLRSLGLVYPFNLAFGATCIAASAGGTMLTGLDGDMLLDTWSMRGLSRLAHGERRPWRGDIATLARAARPRRWRDLPADWATYFADATWLTPHGRDLVIDAAHGWSRAEPRTWPGFVRWHHQARRSRWLRENCDRVGALHDTSVAHPLLDPGFLAALGHRHRFRGPGGRDRAVADLVGHVLPASLCARRSKGGFDEAFVTPRFRDFARHWTGTGIPVDLVDPDALQRAWLADEVDLGSATLAQMAWMHAHGISSGVTWS